MSQASGSHMTQKTKPQVTEDKEFKSTINFLSYKSQWNHYTQETFVSFNDWNI